MYVHADRICVHAREIDTRKVGIHGRRGGGIDDSKVGGFLTTNDGCVSARGEKERGEKGSKTAKSIPRDESNVNLSGYFVRGVKP